MTDRAGVGAGQAGDPGVAAGIAFGGAADADAAAAAARAWAETVRGFLAHSAETPRAHSRLMALAPDCAAGHALLGLFYLLLGRAELARPAAEALIRAEAAERAQGASPRERALIGALADYAQRRPRRAADRLADWLHRAPGDALAMKLVHAIRFVLGDRAGMRASIEGAIGAYGPDHPHGGYALGCLAFALEETGDYAGAERAGRAGLERARDDAWGLHAVAHVYDMTARVGQGVAFLEAQTAVWAGCNNFAGHVWWHLALFHLDAGAFDRALALYDSHVRAERTDDYRDIANAASLLVRLELEGVDVGGRWDELADLAAARVEPGCLVFADLHYLMALGGAGRPADVRRMVERLAADAARDAHEMDEIAATAGLPAAQGLAAFRAGRFGLAYERLAATRPRLGRIGGSHAQRDVFSRLMIEAAIRARRWDEAEAELIARAKRRGAVDGYTDRRLRAISRARSAQVAAE